MLKAIPSALSSLVEYAKEQESAPAKQALEADSELQLKPASEHAQSADGAAVAAHEPAELPESSPAPPAADEEATPAPAAEKAEKSRNNHACKHHQ